MPKASSANRTYRSLHLEAGSASCPLADIAPRYSPYESGSAQGEANAWAQPGTKKADDANAIRLLFFRLAPSYSTLCSASATARNIARRLLMVSSHSSAGTESATIPPPACTWSSPFLITAVRMAMAVSMLPFHAR